MWIESNKGHQGHGKTLSTHGNNFPFVNAVVVRSQQRPRKFQAQKVISIGRSGAYGFGSKCTRRTGRLSQRSDGRAGNFKANLGDVGHHTASRDQHATRADIQRRSELQELLTFAVATPDKNWDGQR